MSSQVIFLGAKLSPRADLLQMLKVPDSTWGNMMDGIGGGPSSVEGFKLLSRPSRTPKKMYFSVE